MHREGQSHSRHSRDSQYIASPSSHLPSILPVRFVVAPISSSRSLHSLARKRVSSLSENVLTTPQTRVSAHKELPSSSFPHAREWHGYKINTATPPRSDLGIVITSRRGSSVCIVPRSMPASGERYGLGTRLYTFGTPTHACAIKVVVCLAGMWINVFMSLMTLLMA